MKTLFLKDEREFNDRLIRRLKFGDVMSLEELVKQGADPDHRSSSGWTPLMKVCRNGRLDIARFLLQCGASVDTVNDHGETCLWLAIVYYNGSTDLVQLLLTHGASVDAALTSSGATPLMMACMLGHLEIVQILLRQANGPANVINAACGNGTTALHAASENGNANVVEFLIANGANMEAVTKSGETPLTMASRNEEWEVLKIFALWYCTAGRMEVFTASDSIF